jgi:hypothetical protein
MTNLLRNASLLAMVIWCTCADQSEADFNDKESPRLNMKAFQNLPITEIKDWSAVPERVIAVIKKRCDDEHFTMTKVNSKIVTYQLPDQKVMYLAVCEHNKLTSDLVLVMWDAHSQYETEVCLPKAGEIGCQEKRKQL